MLITRLTLALPMAFTWMFVTANLTPGAFVVGYLFSLAVLFTLRASASNARAKNLPAQIGASIVYVLLMFREIFLSSIDVARRLLSPDMRLQTGIIAVATGDEKSREVPAALSAHNITITPGELVVDFKGNDTLFVHCLDVPASLESADFAQARRLRLMRQILGD